jgi:hypothetical protein
MRNEGARAHGRAGRWVETAHPQLHLPGASRIFGWRRNHGFLATMMAGAQAIKTMLVVVCMAVNGGYKASSHSLRWAHSSRQATRASPHLEKTTE